MSCAAFFDDDHNGHCAFPSDGERGGPGFVVMNHRQANHTHFAPVGFFDPKPTSAWFVEGSLLGPDGKWWFRDWWGVMDDFGDLIEIEIDMPPF
ncbi:MAG: hypothetical protein ABI893_00570 [Polaromonas sp.]